MVKGTGISKSSSLSFYLSLRTEIGVYTVHCIGNCSESVEVYKLEYLSQHYFNATMTFILPLATDTQCVLSLCLYLLEISVAFYIKCNI